MNWLQHNPMYAGGLALLAIARAFAFSIWFRPGKDNRFNDAVEAAKLGALIAGAALAFLFVDFQRQKQSLRESCVQENQSKKEFEFKVYLAFLEASNTNDARRKSDLVVNMAAYRSTLGEDDDKGETGKRGETNEVSEKRETGEKGKKRENLDKLLIAQMTTLILQPEVLKEIKKQPTVLAALAKDASQEVKDSLNGQFSGAKPPTLRRQAELLLSQLRSAYPELDKHYGDHDGYVMGHLSGGPEADKEKADYMRWQAEFFKRKGPLFADADAIRDKINIQLGQSVPTEKWFYELNNNSFPNQMSGLEMLIAQLPKD